MAVSTPALKATIADGTLAESYTSPSFTPANGDLLIVAMNIDFDVGTFHVQPTITTTLSNVGTWSFKEADNGLASGNYLLFAYAKITGTPGTGTLTFAFGTGNGRDNFLAKIYTVTGYNTTTPVATNIATGTGGSTSATAAAGTFGSTPASDSLVMVITGLIGPSFSNTQVPITQRAGYTEADDWYIYNPTYQFCIQGEVQYLNGSATTSISSTWGTSLTWIILGIEVQAAAGASFIAPEPVVVPQSLKRSSYW